MSSNLSNALHGRKPQEVRLPFSDSRLRQIRLEDGEVVVPLGRARLQDDVWPSSRPHAGKWSDSESYALLTSVTRAVGVANYVRAFDPCLNVLVTDCEILVRGPHNAIERLILEGPRCLRARCQRNPSSASHLAAFAFRVPR